MTIKAWGAYLFLMVIFVIGCSSNAPSAPSTLKQTPNLKDSPFRAYSNPSAKQQWEVLVSRLSQLSVITKEGYEISLNKESFVQAFSKNPWEQTGHGKIEDPFLYTVLLQSPSYGPVAILLSDKGVNWDGNYYTGEAALKFIRYIETEASKKFILSLKSGQVALTAKDLRRSIRLSPERRNEIMGKLREAVIISGKPRLLYPLFPYYVLEVATGGKEVIPIEILSPTLVSLQLGGKTVYYQVNDSLYGPLKNEIGFVDYSRANLKYLYKAYDLQVLDHQVPYEKTKLLINHMQLGDFEATSVIHQIVRELAAGTKLENREKERNLPSLILQFRLEQTVIPVQVYDDHFIYGNSVYEKKDILQKLRSLTQKKSFFVKQGEPQ